jgi:hypothetical protein
MALQDITITGSIKSIPTQSYGQKIYISSTDEQSFPIEQITGSNGGALPNFNGQYSTTGLFVNVTQSWTVVEDTKVGLVTSIHNTQDEFINGEYSGSDITVTTQRLVDDDCIKFLEINTTEVFYDPFFYSSNVTSLSAFLDQNTTPNNGQVYIFWNYTPPDITFGIESGVNNPSESPL